MEKTLYFYKALVTKVYDGDTITVDIDLGLKIFVRGEKIRLFGIDAPEVRGTEREKGLISRDYLRGLILDKNIFIKTIKDRKGKYGRYLGVVFLKYENENMTNINNLLVEKGYAEFREY